MIQALPSSASSSPRSRFIERIRVVEPAGRAQEVHRLPDGRTSLVFRVLEEGHDADVWVAGPRTHAHFKPASGVVRAVILQLKPGCSAPLLGVPANELTDRLVPLQELWGHSGRALWHALRAAPSVPAVVEQLESAVALRARQTSDPASGPLVRHAVRLLEAGEGRVERVAHALGITARHLRRAFTESVGIGPKEFARTVRLQRALRSAATSKDWARIASDAGYYDQAHLIADFRQLIGLTPCAFLKRVAERGSW